MKETEIRPKELFTKYLELSRKDFIDFIEFRDEGKKSIRFFKS